MISGQRIKLGFSTGALYKTHDTKQAAAVIRSLGCLCIELGLLRLERIYNGWLEAVTKDDLSDFEYVSLHAPMFAYGVDTESKEILSRIKNFHDNIRQLDLVVFHPDSISDFSVLAESGLPVGLENMDNRKNSFRGPEDMSRALSANPSFSMILDLNHIYTNDQSMALAKRFKSLFADKIKQVHLSGFAGRHEPLFETQQAEILNEAKDMNAPIIVESVLTTEKIKQEQEYILNYLSARRGEGQKT